MENGGVGKCNHSVEDQENPAPWNILNLTYKKEYGLVRTMEDPEF